MTTGRDGLVERIRRAVDGGDGAALEPLLLALAALADETLLRRVEAALGRRPTGRRPGRRRVRASRSPAGRPRRRAAARPPG
ncbi:hypothetical protein [Kitasatospora sp. NPDC094015]|uniref:hypothetical protein n=1 Tax=Kitasatospora sp. NPDC094015 TaxID=3155205 RepID=UPI003328335D